MRESEYKHSTHFTCHSWSLESGQGAKETAGQAGLVRVAQELSVEVLVPRQGQALALSNLVKCLVQDVHLHSKYFIEW